MLDLGFPSLIQRSHSVYEIICEVLGSVQQPHGTAQSPQGVYRLNHVVSSPKVLTPVFTARKQVPHHVASSSKVLALGTLSLCGLEQITAINQGSYHPRFPRRELFTVAWWLTYLEPPYFRCSASNEEHLIMQGFSLALRTFFYKVIF